MSTSEIANGDGDLEYGDRTQPTEEILSALSMNSPKKDDSAEPQVPPPSEYVALTAQLAESSHDPDGWRRLVDIAEESGDIEKICATYEALLKQYPNNARAQIQYISHFVNVESTFESAKDLFQKFLLRSPCVELWVFYLNYVRRINVGPGQQNNIQQSYEFALNHVGQDKDSGSIWSDYIQFLKNGETTSTWEEQQKMDQLRKVYHKAVQIPLDNVERLWSELETFETNLNKITAKKFMADLSPAHMQARTVLRQLINHVAPLYSSDLQELYLPSLPKFDASERAIVGKWKAYLKWEESNPLEIEEKDKATLITRIQGVYRKAVIRMRYYTEIWFMAYTWTKSIGKEDEAMSILKAGLEANPSSFLLTFAYAEALEIKKDLPEVHATYEKFIGILRAKLDALKGSSTGGNTSVPNSQNSNGDPSSQQSSFTTQPDVEPKKTTELQKHRTEYGLAWIMYMRFAMRAEGVRPSRAVFGKARKDRWTPWEVFEAAALMEYHHSDDKSVASRIFEKGLDLYGDEIEYVVRYLAFLISINDESNARALFERVIPNFPPERARPLWERWARYEYQYGDLERSLKLEKRMSEVYSSDPPIKRLAQRYVYLGTDAIADRDLGVAMARRATNSSGSLGRSENSSSLLQSSQSINNGNLPAQGHSNKRPASPEHRGKREDGRTGEYGAAHKRQRAVSPTRGPERERDRETRWDGPSRRRFSPPPAAWDRDDRGGGGGGGPGRARVLPQQEREEDKSKGVQLPGVLNYFIGQLPSPASFDGPVFRIDDLMNLFRTAVIPSTSGRPKSPLLPPPRSGGGRPPPDYGPYQGPTGGPRRRY